MRTKIGALALAAALVFAPLTHVAASSFASSRAALQDDAPSDAEQTLFTRGQNLFIQGQFQQAVTVLKDFIKTYPNSVITDLTLLWLGRSHMQLGQLPEAEQIGQRLRLIKDTPFLDIYDSELQVARRESAARPPSNTTVAAATPTPVATQIAAARPTPRRAAPTPTPTPQLPRLIIRNETPETEVATNPPTRERRNTRRNQRTPLSNTNANTATPASGQTSSATNRNVASAPRPTPTPRPSRRNEVASNTPPRTTPPVTPTRTPAAEVVTQTPVSEPPASETASVSASTPITTTLPSEQAGAGFSITVKQVPNLNLALRREAVAASPGQVVQMPLIVTNQGNKEDQFRLETDLPAEYQPTFSLAQSGTDTGLPILITPEMARNGNLEVLLNFRIPDNAPDNQQRRFIVRAASQSDFQIFRVADASLTVVAAALAATSNVSQETVMPGETFTQTISMRNQGSGLARSARADFVFNPDFELVSANPSPLVYDRASRTAIWSLGDLDSRDTRDISVTLRAVPDALAITRTIGRGTMRTASLTIPSNFDGPSISVGRVTRARIDAVSAGLTATPGDTFYIPFIVRNPSNYPEGYELRITAPGAPAATIYADSNGDGQHQESEPAITQTGQIEPRGGQYPLLLKVDIPRSTPDRQQFAYNLVTRAIASNRIASEASTVLTVAAPRVRVRTEQVTDAAAPGDTIFYRLVLVNEGGGLAKNLTVTEQLPEALQFVNSDPSLNPQDAPGNSQRFVWRVAELAPGDTSVLRIAVRLRANLAAGAELSPRHTLVYQDTNSNSYQSQ